MFNNMGIINDVLKELIVSNFQTNFTIAVRVFVLLLTVTSTIENVKGSNLEIYTRKECKYINA